jgi:hypothetical protein
MQRDGATGDETGWLMSAPLLGDALRVRQALRALGRSDFNALKIVVTQHVIEKFISTVGKVLL